jgi:hypothetical protein
MATLEEAVSMLASTDKDLDLMARFLSVDAREVQAALQNAEEDSANGVALRLLAKYNPVSAPVQNFASARNSAPVTDTSSQA